MSHAALVLTRPSSAGNRGASSGSAAASAGRQQRVGEERAGAPRVVVGRVEHHALARAQPEHRGRGRRPAARAPRPRRRACGRARRRRSGGTGRRGAAGTSRRAPRSAASATRAPAGRSASGPRIDRLSSDVRYPNASVTSGSVRTRPRARSQTRTVAMLCDTSWPYAPTFCTGVAPVEPGMPDSASMPGELLLDRVPHDVVPRRARRDRERGAGARGRVGHLDAASARRARRPRRSPRRRRAGSSRRRATSSGSPSASAARTASMQLGLGRRLDVPPAGPADAQRREVGEGGRGRGGHGPAR